jgi:hypothetical protein
LTCQQTLPGGLTKKGALVPLHAGPPTPGTNMKHIRQGAWKYYDSRLIKVNFSIIDNPTLERLISDIKSVHAFRLFLYLLRHVNGRIEQPKDPNSGILIGEQIIMDRLGFSRSTLYRAKSELEALGVVKRIKIGRRTVVNFSCVTQETQQVDLVENSVENSKFTRVTDDTHQNDPNETQAPELDQKNACHTRPYDQDQEQLQYQLPPSPQGGKTAGIKEKEVQSLAADDWLQDPLWPLPTSNETDSHLIGALLRLVLEEQKGRKAKGIPHSVNDVITDWQSDPHMAALNMTKPRDHLILHNGKKGSFLEVVGRFYGPKRKRDIVKAIKFLHMVM